METKETKEKFELTPYARKMLSAAINKQLKEVYDSLCADFDVENFDFRTWLKTQIDEAPMIPIPKYGIEVNAYDIMSSVTHVLLKNKAELLRKIAVKTVLDAAEHGYIVKTEKKEED